MSRRKLDSYEGLGKHKLEYVKVVPKFLQALGVSSNNSNNADNVAVKKNYNEDDGDLAAQEERELIQSILKEQEEEKKRREEFLSEMGLQEHKDDTTPEVDETEKDTIHDGNKVGDTKNEEEGGDNTGGKILYKKPPKRKLEISKHNKTTEKSNPPTKKPAVAVKNKTLLSFEDNE